MFMTRCSIGRYLANSWLIFSGLAMPLDTHGQETTVDQSELRRSLVNTWDAQLDEIVTAKISFRRFNHAGGFRPLAPDQVRGLFNASDLISTEMALAELVNSLLAQPHWAVKPWSEMSFLVEGDRTREDLVGHHAHVFDGTDEILTNSANSTVTLGPPPGPPRYRNQLADFRYLVPRGLHPQVRLGGARSDGLTTVYFGDDPDASHTELVVDAQTGAVHEHIQWHRKGVVFRQTLQSHWTTVPPGIEFPMAYAEFEYSREAGLLRGAKIVVVAEIRVNELISDDTFKVAVERGTRIRDFRGDQERDDYAAAATDDVKNYVAAVGPVFPAPLTPLEENDSNGFRFWLVVVNVVCLIVIVVGHQLWRRAGRRRGT